MCLAPNLTQARMVFLFPVVLAAVFPPSASAAGRDGGCHHQPRDRLSQ